MRGSDLLRVISAACLLATTSLAATSVEFTYVPPYGSFSNLQGKVYGVNTLSNRVVVFINKGQQNDSSLSSWSSEPGCASGKTIFTTIQSNGTWTADITNVSGDTNATQIAAYVVPATSGPPCVTSSACLPASILQQSVASTIATRSAPNMRTIQWSGLDWWLKSVYWGPGPNFFTNSTNNVFVDGQGRLHLRITHVNGNWYCSEIVSHRTLGLGSYYFYLDTPVDALDPNITLGLFTWSNAPDFTHREIDVEGGRWGDSGDYNNAQFVVQPYNFSNHLVRYRVPPSAINSMHSFNWQSDSIAFTAVTGTTTVASWTYTSGFGTVPPSCDENVRLNLWLNNPSGPINGQEAEVIVNKFVFIGPDADADGMPDWWELAHGLNPNDPADAARDDDGDSFTNLQEYLAGTDPANPGSHPSLVVTPGAGLASQGLQGGPFMPSNTTYTLTNVCTDILSWRATNTTAWVTLSPAAGTLAAHTSTNVTVSINANANALPVGSYSDTVTFTNLSTTTGSTSRSVSLAVNLPSVITLAAADLQDRFGTLMPASSVAVLVADTGNNGFADLQSDFSLSLGATWSTDDKVAGLWDLSACGTDGCLVDQTVVVSTNGIAPGQQLQLYWFPSLTLAATTLGNTYYGRYTDTNSPPLNGSGVWQTPASGSSVGLYFFTALQNGSNPQTAGRATNVTIAALTLFQNWQIQHFGSTNNPSAAAGADPDGDGMGNMAEFLAGTDPTNSASLFGITGIATEGDDLRVTWMTGPGRTNTLQRAVDASANYDTNHFADVFIVTNTVGSTTNHVDTGAATNSAGYYRVRLPQ